MPFQNIDNHFPVRPFPINFPDAKTKSKIKKTNQKIRNTKYKTPFVESLQEVFYGAKPPFKIFFHCAFGASYTPL
jgi:hypothetical protein